MSRSERIITTLSPRERSVYTAGIIDGEGTITLSHVKANENRSPVISVTSTSWELVDILETWYGGTISIHKVYEEHHKQAWSWKARGDRAIQVLEEIIPFLREYAKRYRAELILDKYKAVTKRNGKYSEEEKLSKLAFEEEFFKPYRHTY